MVDVLDAELGRIIKVRVPSIKVKRRSRDKPIGLISFVGLLSCASKQLIVTKRASELIRSGIDI